MKIMRMRNESNDHGYWEFIINKPFDIAKSRRNITQWRIYHRDDGYMLIFVSCVSANGELQTQPIAMTSTGNLVITNETTIL